MMENNAKKYSYVKEYIVSQNELKPVSELTSPLVLSGIKRLTKDGKFMGRSDYEDYLKQLQRLDNIEIHDVESLLVFEAFNNSYVKENPQAVNIVKTMVDTYKNENKRYLIHDIDELINDCCVMIEPYADKLIKFVADSNSKGESKKRKDYVNHLIDNSSSPIYHSIKKKH